jgi:hypothetical protein
MVIFLLLPAGGHGYLDKPVILWSPRLKAILMANHVNCLHGVSGIGYVGYTICAGSFTRSTYYFYLRNVTIDNSNILD